MLSLVLTAFLLSDGHSIILRYADVTERLTFDVVGRYVRVTHLYAPGLDVPPLRGCPRTVDLFEWRGDELFYVQTDNWFDRTRVVYRPGHLWVSRADVPGQVSWRWTEGETFELRDADGDCNADGVWPTGQPTKNLIWRALVLTDDGVRLDEVTWVGGRSSDSWKEAWFWTTGDSLPYRTMGWRNDAVIWDGWRVGVER